MADQGTGKWTAICAIVVFLPKTVAVTYDPLNSLPKDNPNP